MAQEPFFFIVVRGPVPRDLYVTMRFRSYGPEENQRRFFRNSNDGEGNPLGCAYGIRGPKPYDEGGPFCRRGPRRRAALLHRDAGGLAYGGHR